jgi:hypothetical protein
MSVRTTIAALALAGFGLAGGAVAAAPGVLTAAAPTAAVLTTFGNPHQPAAVTLDDITGGSPQSQGIPIPH